MNPAYDGVRFLYMMGQHFSRIHDMTDQTFCPTPVVRLVQRPHIGFEWPRFRSLIGRHIVRYAKITGQAGDGISPTGME